MLFTGQVATAWNHPLSAIGDFQLDPANAALQNEVARILGRVVEWMQMTSIKYAFLSTYEETVYVKIVDDARVDTPGFSSRPSSISDRKRMQLAAQLSGPKKGMGTIRDIHSIRLSLQCLIG